MFVSFVCFVVQNFNWIGLWYGDCENESDNDHQIERGSDRVKLLVMNNLYIKKGVKRCLTFPKSTIKRESKHKD